jgi:hypothetical protein
MLLILLIGGAVSIGVGVHLSRSAFDAPYPKLDDLVLGCVAVIFGIYALISTLKIDKLFIYNDRLEVLSLFNSVKKVIYLNEITTWTEIEKENKYYKWQELTIFTDTTKYCIVSNYYSNFLALKKALTKGKPRNHEKEKQHNRRVTYVYVIAFAIIGIALLYGTYYTNSKIGTELTDDDLTTITDVITNKPEITKGRKGHRSIDIKLKSYPEFDFDVSGISYKATYASHYADEVKTGDSLTLQILTSEYEGKLLKTKPLGFWAKHSHYYNIDVYGLSDAKNTYLKVSNYNIEKDDDRSFVFWFLLVLGAFFTGISTYVFFAEQEQSNPASRKIPRLPRSLRRSRLK